MRAVEPQTKFVGVSLAFPGQQPAFFEHFLNPKNHKPGIPLDFISYHFYAVPAPDQGTELQPHVFFAQADGFLNTVRYVEAIRKRLSPSTRTTINEIGSIAADDLGQGEPGYVFKPIPGLLLEPGGGDVRVPVRRADAPGHRRGRGVAARRVPDPVPERVDGGLDERKAQPALLGAEAPEGQLRPRRQAGGHADGAFPSPLRPTSTPWASSPATASGGFCSSTSATATSSSSFRARAEAGWTSWTRPRSSTRRLRRSSRATRSRSAGWRSRSSPCRSCEGQAWRRPWRMKRHGRRAARRPLRDRPRHLLAAVRRPRGAPEGLSRARSRGSCAGPGSRW